MKRSASPSHKHCVAHREAGRSWQTCSSQNRRGVEPVLSTAPAARPACFPRSGTAARFSHSCRGARVGGLSGRRSLATTYTPILYRAMDMGLCIWRAQTVTCSILSAERDPGNSFPRYLLVKWAKLDHGLEVSRRVGMASAGTPHSSVSKCPPPAFLLGNPSGSKLEEGGSPRFVVTTWSSQFQR